MLDRLEQVQPAAARIVFADYRRTTSFTPLINNIGWDSLYTQQLVAQNTMFFKTNHNLVNFSMSPNFQPATFLARHDHQFKYSIPTAIIDAFKFSFYPRGRARTVFMFTVNKHVNVHKFQPTIKCHHVQPIFS